MLKHTRVFCFVVVLSLLNFIITAVSCHLRTFCERCQSKQAGLFVVAEFQNYGNFTSLVYLLRKMSKRTCLFVVVQFFVLSCIFT